jgi:glutathionylspermidine synthase
MAAVIFRETVLSPVPRGKFRPALRPRVVSAVMPRVVEASVDYQNRRRRIFDPLRQEGIFTWDWMYEKEYALANLHMITRQEREELARATEQLGRIYAKTVAVVQQGDAALLMEMGIPRAAVDAVRMSFLPDMPTIVGRLDFVRTEQGWKMLELNSDTPGGVVEAFYVNGKVCTYFGAVDPNAGLGDDLTKAFQYALDQYKSLGYKTDNVFFSALDWHVEDLGTTRFLQKYSGLSAQFVALKDLRIYEDGLFAWCGADLVPVDVLYRLHPLGILAEECDEDGYPTGAHVLDLAARGKLALINPPGALIAQTKALQALIWNLHEQGEFYDAAEHAAIATYMLPTYLENRFLGKQPYVSKPVLGREGSAVTLYRTDGAIVERCQEEESYWDQEMVFQQYVELEPVEVETLEGLYQGRLIWGSFLIGGKASAITARVDGLITTDLAYSLAVGMIE